MPLYDYDCAQCGRRFEVVHGVYVDGPTSCPLCGGGPVRKAITAAAIHYKGSGWAKKERRASSATSSKGNSESSASGGDDGPSSTEKSDTAKTEKTTTTESATKTKEAGSTASSKD